MTAQAATRPHNARYKTPVLQAFESVLVVMFLIMFSEGLVQRLVSPDSSPDGSSLLRLLWLPAYAWALVMAAINWRNMFRIGLRNPFLLLLTAMTLVSVLWSIDPAITLRRAIALGCTTLFGLYLAARYSWPEILRLLGWAWLVVGIANLITSAAVPSIGVDHEIHIGAWQGLYTEKNALGGGFARASFLFAVLVLADKRYRWPWIAGCLLAVLLVLMSTSKTALLGMLLGFAVLVAYHVMKRGAMHAIGLIWASTIGVLLIAVGLFLVPDLIFGLIGKDASLTGRTDIWEALAKTIAQKPWLGYGYGAFWELSSVPAHWVRLAVEWEAPTAHNGWLEVLLAVGFIGMVWFVLNLGNTGLRAIRSAMTGWGGVFACGFLLQFLLFSMSESIVIQQNSMTWLTYVLVAGRLAMDAFSRSSARPREGGVHLSRRSQARGAIET